MNRKKESFIKGASTEQAFVYAMNQAGKQVEVSSREQNIEDHIDFFVDGVSVDVKGDRHLDCIWLELRNVNGKYGWLKGKAKYIVMDIKEMNGFVFFLRKDLLRYADQFKERTASKEDYYKLLKGNTVERQQTKNLLFRYIFSSRHYDSKNALLIFYFK